ncbi:SDR family oxidoreductase [Aeromicrobium sp. CnD17-E]|uniref:SDR family oxidoreductase n=1 Tax=Aeromicrobium sp. CnD17-E TaxID=2954487 RepID=UPI002097BDE3|nr:SDR family oxidoreductase [Aeromicrobium sp. CnD17-E]MCO7240952.1 SDR family oxidoreductase [Aeromicrobium sp. CnD17-E]
MKVQGAAAVVTGAAGGIGLAVARALLERGAASVVLADLDGDRLSDAASALGEEFGERVLHRAADVTAEIGVDAVLQTSPTPVDLYVANAGVFQGFGLDASPQDWAASWEVNVMAHVAAARALVPQWLERGATDGPAGCFVSVASAAGLLTQLGSPTYSVTKHAAVGFAEWLAATYGDRGVQVTTACPMGVRTAMLEEGETSTDADARLGMRAVTSAGEALDASEVAATILDAVEAGRFQALPHPEVATMWAQKASDPDRWVAGMQRYRRTLES